MCHLLPLIAFTLAFVQKYGKNYHKKSLKEHAEGIPF